MIDKKKNSKSKNSKTKRTSSPTKGFIAKRPLNRNMALAAILIVVVSGYALARFSHASSCTISSTLVNSCRPLFGGAVSGDPRAASDPISQVTYLEGQIGHQLDVVHFYNGVGDDTLSSSAVHFATRSNTYLYQNWKGPTSNWGSISSYNSGIDSMADSVKSLGSKKIFLTYWHEPENDVSSGGDSNCPNVAYKGSSGTVTQYKAAWAYVENRFKADGVTNVVWVMNYMGYKAWDCLIPDMWPGNNLIDWVTFDTYPTDSIATWTGTVGRMYNLLSADSTATDNFDSKPWGVGEFGSCNLSTEQGADGYLESAKTALDASTYPKLKLYMVYDDTGNNAGPGCLTDSNIAGTYDPSRQSLFNKFADDPIFASANPATPVPTSTPISTPTPSAPTPAPKPSPSSTPKPDPTRTPTPVPAPPHTGSLTLIPSSDTYVYDNQPDSNFGGADPLLATSNEYRALLRLKTDAAIPSGSHIIKATLMLYVRGDAVTTGGFEIHPENPSGWAADTVTWNTQPIWNTTVLATSATPTIDQWISISLPANSIDLSGDTTFGIRYTASNSGASFSSREDPTTPPKLVISYQSN
jgi:hypothetical protein